MTVISHQSAINPPFFWGQPPFSPWFRAPFCPFCFPSRNGSTAIPCVARCRAAPEARAHALPEALRWVRAAGGVCLGVGPGAGGKWFSSCAYLPSMGYRLDIPFIVVDIHFLVIYISIF